MSIQDQFGDSSSGVKETIEAEYDDGSDDVRDTESFGGTFGSTACCLPEM